MHADPEKVRLRQHCLERRRAMPAARRAAESAAAAERLVAAMGDGPAGPIGLFASFAEEIDTSPLAALLAARGQALCLPRQDGRERPLAFHRWRPGEPLAAGPFRVPEPSPEQPLVTPRVLVVPLLAFDRHGARLGYGAGYYDRTLAALRAPGPVQAIGLAFDTQEVDRVPVSAHDEPLDLVITPTRVVVPQPDRPAGEA